MTISGIATGENGGIAVGAETTYGTAAAAKVWQHGKTSTIGPSKAMRPPKQLAPGLPAVRDYTIGAVEGDIVCGYNDSRAVVGHILANCGALTSDVYKIGDLTAADTESLTIWSNIDGWMLENVGCVASALKFDLAADSEVVMTATYLGRAGTKEAAVAPSAPAETGIVMGSDLGTISLGGATMCVLGASIEVSLPLTSSGRICLGSTGIKVPQRVPLQMVKASLTVELSDDTDNDTEAEMDNFLDETAAGDLAIGSLFELVGCYVTGDLPALGPGLIEFPINVEAQYLNVTTTA